MKKISILIAICLATIAAVAQQKADIEVSYTAFSPNFKNGDVDVKKNYVLLANTSESKFYSPKTEYIDSLNSTPEGKAKFQEMSRAAVMGGKFDDIPKKDGSYYVVKSTNSNTLRYYDSAGMDQYYYDETPEEWMWEISDSTKNVIGYECVKASVDFHGRKWVAWFSPEIPISNGPWKLGGLPGLILEASTADGKYGFVATGIQQTSKPIGIIYLADGYEKTGRKSFLKAKRAFIDNPLGKINAQFAGNGKKVLKVKNQDGADISNSIFVMRTVADFIETDY